MNTEGMFLFLILLLGLILCSFLGGNYGTKEGMTSNQFSGRGGGQANTYTGASGNTAAVAVGPQGNVYTGSNVNGQTNTNTSNQGNSSVNTYTGASGNTAGVVVGPQGNVYTGSNVNGQVNTNTNANTNANTNNTAYDNYNHYNGTTTPTVYYGPNGAIAKVDTSNGTTAIIVTDSNGTATTYSINTSTSSSTTTSSSSSTSNPDIYKSTFYGPNGYTATVAYDDSTGAYAVKVVDPNGQITIYTSTNNTSYNNNYPNTASAGAAYSPYGGSAGYATGPNGNSAAYVSGPNGTTVTTNTATDTATVSSNGSTTNTGSTTSPWYGTQGVSSSQIPAGDEDLYILKSQVVPPVCPACPQAGACPRQEPCAPCPACARCPEPAFECKKVPNYNALNNEYMPVPVVNSFSTFGM